MIENLKVAEDQTAYEKARKLLHGERTVTVMLDGNRTKAVVNGKPMMVKTQVWDNIVTIKKCHDIIKNLANFDCHPHKLTIDLSVYTQTEGNEFGDYPEECLLKKVVYYNVDKDKLVIWKNGLPVYENNHGVICRDSVALADCYL